MNISFLDYSKFKKRKLIVLHMMTMSSTIEGYLDMSNIPYHTITYDDDIENEFLKHADDACGIIISGSNTEIIKNIHGKDVALPSLPKIIFDSDFPKLGICYGNEILGYMLGSKIIYIDEKNPETSETGSVKCTLKENPIFDDTENFYDGKVNTIVTMNHAMMLKDLPDNTELIASTDITPIAGFYHKEKQIWGLQFHPEKSLNRKIFKNFYKICMK